MNNRIHLIAMDMDGTLLDDHQQITPANLEALHRATEAGIHIALCSGRMSGDASAYAVDAKLPECHILALNGACALERPNGKLLWTRHLPTDTLDEAVRVLLETKITTFGCFEPNRVVALPQERLDEGDHSVWGARLRSPDAPVYEAGMAAYQAARARGVCKLVCIENDEALLRQTGEKLRAIPGLAVTSSWRTNWELMPVGVDKGMAVRMLAEALGLERNQVMTLGDYDNDLSMIAYAGCGVAMGNASESVKQVADHITDTNLRDGVAKAIKRYALA